MRRVAVDAGRPGPGPGLAAIIGMSSVDRALRILAKREEGCGRTAGAAAPAPRIPAQPFARHGMGALQVAPPSCERTTKMRSIVRDVGERKNDRPVAELDRAAHAIAAGIGRRVDRHTDRPKFVPPSSEACTNVSPGPRAKGRNFSGSRDDGRAGIEFQTMLRSAAASSCGKTTGSIFAFSRASGSGYQRKRHWFSRTRPLRSSVRPAHSYARRVAVRNRNRRRPRLAAIERADQHVLVGAVLRRMQDDLAARRAIEDDDDLAVREAHAVRMRAIGVGIRIDQPVLEDLHVCARAQAVVADPDRLGLLILVHRLGAVVARERARSADSRRTASSRRLRRTC